MTQPAFLVSMPIDLLPVSDELKRSLHGFAVHRMGQFAALFRDITSDIFRVEDKLARQLCNDIDDSPCFP